MPNTPLIICIDVEPDERAMHLRDREDWVGFEQTWAYVQGMRALLAKATGAPAHFSWFLRMDPQVDRVYGSPAWVMSRYGRLIRELRAAGDEMGLHPHFWRWDEAQETWIADFGSQAWVTRCVRQSFEAFEQRFGQPCRSVRLGDGWMNGTTMGLMERLGARFDLTVEPGRTPDAPVEPFTGSLPDYTRAPRDPYRPARRDWQTPGGWWRRRLWEIPLSTGRPAWAATVSEEKTRSAAPGHDEAEGGVAPIYEGWHDHGDPGRIEGWVYDAARPDAIVAVDVFEDRMLIATLRADCFRPDLLSAGKGHGRHAFVFPVPDRLRDGKTHAIRIMVAGTGLALHDTPREIQCRPTDALPRDYVPLNLSSNPGVFRGMFDAILIRHRTPHLALVVRSDAGRDPVQRANLAQNFEHLLAHPEISRFTIATPAEAIDLLRR